MRVRCRIEPLEGRSLLSTTAIGGPDQPPVLADLGTRSVNEGDTLAIRATATDPNAGHSVTYSLDPGAPAGATIDPASGAFVWTPPNVQAIYAISIRATDSGTQGLSAAKTLTVMVFDVPPVVNAGINAAIAQGTEFLRSGSFTDSNPDTWTATVDYGDGSGVQPLALNPDKTFRLDHAYATPGNYTVSVTIADSQGGVGHGYFAVQVLTPGPPGASASAVVAGGTQTPAATAQGASSVETGQTPSANNSSANGTTSHSLSPLLVSKAKHPRARNPVHGPRGHKHH